MRVYASPGKTDMGSRAKKNSAGKEDEKNKRAASVSEEGLEKAL